MNPRVVRLVFLGLFVLAIVTSLYFFSQYQKSQKEVATLKKDSSVIAKAEVKSLVSKVGNFLELPKDEDPTVATITDLNKLKGQQFFANAKNGDKLLIYTKSKKAILYRPSTNKIIEVAPLNIGKQQASPTVALSPTKTPPTPTPSEE